MPSPENSDLARIAKIDAVRGYLRGVEANSEMRGQIREVHQGLRRAGQLTQQHLQDQLAKSTTGISRYLDSWEIEIFPDHDDRWHKNDANYAKPNLLATIRKSDPDCAEVVALGLHLKDGIGLTEYPRLVHNFEFGENDGESLENPTWMTNGFPRVRNFVRLNLHTDAPTAKRAQALLEQDQHKAGMFYTTYYTDETGNYLKFSTMPRAIRDRRLNLAPTKPSRSAIFRPEEMYDMLRGGPVIFFDPSTRIVLSEMHQGDIEILTKVAGALEKSLSQEPK